MADRPDYRLLEDEEDAYGKAPDPLPGTRPVLQKPPQSFVPPTSPTWVSPVPVPQVNVLDPSRNPRLGAEVNTPMMGGVLGLGLQMSPLAPRGQVNPSFGLRYKRPF